MHSHRLTDPNSRAWVSNPDFKRPTRVRRHRRPLVFKILDRLGLLPVVLGLVTTVALVLSPTIQIGRK